MTQVFNAGKGTQEGEEEKQGGRLLHRKTWRRKQGSRSPKARRKWCNGGASIRKESTMWCCNQRNVATTSLSRSTKKTTKCFEYASEEHVQETKRVTTLGPHDAASAFAATLSLEAVRFVLSRAMTEVKEDRGREVVVTFLDISRTHLVKACGEDTECCGHCW